MSTRVRAATFLLLIPGAVLALGPKSFVVPAGPEPALAERIARLTRESPWVLTASVPVSFRTFHAQGMVKVGDALFVSSVEVRVPTKRWPAPVGGYDRDTGEGVGHLFKMTPAGTLLADLVVGEGSIYHPGGIDFDGRHIWVPVAEYRPDSRSIVYRVDPDTMKSTEVLRFADHLGAIVRNPDDSTLHAASWGSRRFYRWTLDAEGRVAGGGAAPDRRTNPSHYVDYQDCKYAGSGQMLCSGVSRIGDPPGGRPFELGGLDLVSLADGRPVHQVPLPLRSAAGASLTRNPVFIETAGAGLRGYFMPDDDRSTLYVYETGVDGGKRN
jgi:hypothetical protein